MPSCAQRLTVFGDTWRSSATCAVRRYLGWVVWGNALSRSCCRPRFGDDPMPVGVGCHRAFYTGWPSSDASRCSLGSPAGAFMDVDQSVVVGPGASLATYRRAHAQVTGRHSHRRAGRHGRMPGCDRQWPSPLLCARQRCTFWLATRRSSLFPCHRRQGRAGVGDTSKTVEGGTST
jgi:hypothetical protein